MSKLTVVIDQEVALFSNRGSFQGFYKVTSVSPKGTKIVVTRDDNYSRTFNGNNVEQNGHSTKFRTDYIRTDVDQVRSEIERKTASNAIVDAFNRIGKGIPANINHFYAKNNYVDLIEELQSQLDAVKELVEKLPK